MTGRGGASLLPACAARSLSAGMARKAASVGAPTLCAKAAPLPSASASEAGVNPSIIAPLSPIAPAILSRDRGEAISTLTDIDPADSPPIVMWLGFPPKAAMFRFTQASAAA